MFSFKYHWMYITEISYLENHVSKFKFSFLNISVDNLKLHVILGFFFLGLINSDRKFKFQGFQIHLVIFVSKNK